MNDKIVLIVEDDQMQRAMLGGHLSRKCDLGSVYADHGRQALDILSGEDGRHIKLVIMDLVMPVMGGMEALEIIKKRHPALPVIILTGSKNVSDAVQAIKLGAVDFIEKPYDGDRIAITVKNALKISLLSKEVSRLRDNRDGTAGFKNVIGYDSGLAGAVQMGRKAASTDLAVLITGETGTGKEVFARAIHGESDRHGQPFVAVNCGAIPSHLVESTLFGHEKGAFTGATEKVIGKFREAQGGTIFLDEVGELPLAAQVKLLRVLQQKEVEPVGGSKPVPVNIRVISATNRDLQEEVNKMAFREDLFFRLNVLQIDLPPLSERKEDIIPLAEHFIERFCANYQTPFKGISNIVKTMFESYGWPGNVRELENIINRAMVVNNGGDIGIDDLSIALKDIENNKLPESTNKSVEENFAYGGYISIISKDGHVMPVKEIEKTAIKIVLGHYGHNITKAATALGMAKSTFYKKMKRP